MYMHIGKGGHVETRLGILDSNGIVLDGILEAPIEHVAEGYTQKEQRNGMNFPAPLEGVKERQIFFEFLLF
jgi:hypothetical protein